MSDDFYGPFDRACLQNKLNRERKEDYRSVFHQDRDRVMFTPTFRRLQAKTQVFQAGEYDFYRTRLTHSLEVANIAKSIVAWLRKNEPSVSIDPDLIEAICLAHDIGHPPFGHAGERALNSAMEDFGGFEGNAQTLRILTRTIFTNADGQRAGMNPSRALLDGILKYKRLYRDRGNLTHHFIYDDQAEILEFCFDPADLKKELAGADPNDFKSIECQIMDYADDVAYSCFDLLDGAKARFLTLEKIDAWSHGAKLDEAQRKILLELTQMLSGGKSVPLMNLKIGELIKGASLVPVKNFMSARTRRYAWKLEISDAAKQSIQLYKAVCGSLIFGSSALQQIEFKGTKILEALVGALFDNYFGPKDEKGKRSGSGSGKVLMPSEVHRFVSDAVDQTQGARLICDYLAGMTDAYALRSYKRLFDPDYGSISELI
jgi:dGTPase